MSGVAEHEARRCPSAHTSVCLSSLLRNARLVRLVQDARQPCLAGLVCMQFFGGGGGGLHDDPFEAFFGGGGFGPYGERLARNS